MTTRSSTSTCHTPYVHMPHAKDGPSSRCLRTTSRASVLDLMEMPDLHQLHLLGLAIARGSCISLSARSRWSRTERGLRPPLLALAGLDEAPQGLQECWCAQEVKVRSLRRAGAAACAPVLGGAAGRTTRLCCTLTSQEARAPGWQAAGALAPPPGRPQEHREKSLRKRAARVVLAATPLGPSLRGQRQARRPAASGTIW
mgnify:CR=1 FL=1